MRSSVADVRERTKAVLKLAKELQNAASAKSAQQLRSQVPGASARDAAIISVLRHHVMAGGGAELFQSLGVKPIVGAFLNSEKSMPVLTEKLIYFGPAVYMFLPWIIICRSPHWSRTTW